MEEYQADAVRHVAPLVLRQEWEKRKRNRQHEGGHPGGELAASRPPLAEKTIREIIQQANDDLAASGVALTWSWPGPPRVLP